MQRIRVSNRTRGRPMGSRIAVADGFWSRLRGLLGRPPLRAGEGLLLVPSRGVHMYGMKHPLDVLLLDGERRVVARYPSLAPWRRTRIHREARYALELPPGVIEETETEEGDLLEWTLDEDRSGR